jgi:asparagine synthase (glutamine-hydrolysing)
MATGMMQALSAWQPDVARFCYLTVEPETQTGLASLSKANAKLETQDSFGFFGSLLLHTTPESLYEVLPYTDPESGLTITADARIDNRIELSLKLGLVDSIHTPDSMYILRAYQKWGRECGQYLLGDYAFAVWDNRRRELFLARDHIGARALFYYVDREHIIFATEPKGITATGEVSAKLADDWIANILVGVYPAKDQAPFENVKKLPPAHYFTVAAGSMRLQRYWDPDVTREIRYCREQDYYDHMRELIDQAVRRCTRSAYPVGAELSGGLDSSGIAAFAQAALKQRGDELHTFSHVLPDWALGKVYPFSDERRYINSLCNYAGITRRHFVTAEGKGILDEFQLCTQRFGYPTGYHFAVFCDALYEEARAAGVRVLLSGFPGDELVTSHGAEFFNEMLYRHHYRTLWREMYTRNGRRFFKTGYTLAVRLLMYHAPGLVRALKGNPPEEVNWRDNSFRCCVASDEYAHRMQLRQRIFDTSTYPVFNSVRARERVRITETFVCHRLEQCAAYALYCGMEYRNPFADRNLVEYVLALPAGIKLRGGIKRYPYRRALEGMLPEDIRWRDDKAGATIPTVLPRIMADSDRIDRLLSDPAVTWPDFVDMDKMRQIKKRLNNKQLKDALYPHSFYSVLMMKDTDTTCDGEGKQYFGS